MGGPHDRQRWRKCSGRLLRLSEERVGDGEVLEEWEIFFIFVLDCWRWKMAAI